MDLKRLVKYEEGDKKNKSLDLRAKEENNSEYDKYMILIVHNLKRIMKRQFFQHKKVGGSIFGPTCYEC